MKNKKLLFFIFFLGIIFSQLQAQENTDEYNDDAFLFVEKDGITITGSNNTTQQIEIVSRETIEKIQSRDVPSLLEESIGLGVTRYGPYGNKADINIRGFNTKRTAILINGIPVNSAASGDFDYNSVDPSSIERIEVIHGGSDTKYNVSGAIGGVINIITVKKQNPGWIFGGGVFNTSYLPGSYNKQYGGIGDPQWQGLADTQNINIFGAYGDENNSFRFDIFGNRAGNNFLYQDEYGYARLKEGNGILDAGASVSYLHEFQNYSKLITTGAFYFGDKNIPVSGYTSEYAIQNDLAARGNLMFEIPKFFHDDFSMELSLSYNWKKLTYDQGGASSIHNEHSVSLINRWSWYANSKLVFRFGGDYNFINLDSTNLGQKNIHYSNRGGVYLTCEFLPVNSFLLIISFKGITDGKEIVPIPKIGLSWSIKENITLKNNYYRSFKFPDFNDLYWVQDGFMGNPNLKNEDGWGIDLGIEFFNKKSFKINSVFYCEQTDNSIHWNNSSGIWQPENYGTGIFLGWDSKLEYFLPFKIGFLEKPIINFSYLFQISRLLSGDLTFNDNKNIPYIPVHTLTASLELPWKTKNKEYPGAFIISCRFESVRYADTANITELKPYFILNILYNQKVNKNIFVFGKINNVTNTHYVSFADYSMPGISLTLGLRANLEVK